MVAYKIYYFEAKGTAELARVMFAQAGQKYEDIRLTGEQWKEFKEKTPFGQMPLLEIDGKKYAQSGAINTYLAKKFDFYGKDAEEDLVIDQFAHCLEDVVKKFPFFEKDEKVKEEKIKNLFGEEYPAMLGMLEKMLDCKDGYVASKLSIADMRWMLTAHFLLSFDKACLDKTPKLKALAQKVEALPNIAKWLKERPDTKF